MVDPTGVTNYLTWSNDGQFIAQYINDGTLRVNTVNQQSLQLMHNNILENVGYFRGCQFSNDSSILFVYGDTGIQAFKKSGNEFNQIIAFDFANTSHITVNNANNYGVNTIAITQDQQYVITACQDFISASNIVRENIIFKYDAPSQKYIPYSKFVSEVGNAKAPSLITLSPSEEFLLCFYNNGGFSSNPDDDWNIYRYSEGIVNTTPFNKSGEWSDLPYSGAEPANWNVGLPFWINDQSVLYAHPWNISRLDINAATSTVTGSKLLQSPTSNSDGISVNDLTVRLDATKVIAILPNLNSDDAFVQHLVPMDYDSTNNILTLPADKYAASNLLQFKQFADSSTLALNPSDNSIIAVGDASSPNLISFYRINANNSIVRI